MHPREDMGFCNPQCTELGFIWRRLIHTHKKDFGQWYFPWVKDFVLRLGSWGWLLLLGIDGAVQHACMQTWNGVGIKELHIPKLSIVFFLFDWTGLGLRLITDFGLLLVRTYTQKTSPVFWPLHQSICQECHAHSSLSFKTVSIGLLCPSLQLQECTPILVVIAHNCQLHFATFLRPP